MKITLESLKKFESQYAQSDLKILDTTGTARTLDAGIPDYWDLAERADRFWCEWSWYTRAQMEEVLDRMLPSNPTQINLPAQW